MNQDSNVVVIDDDESTRRAFLRQLGSAGFAAIGFGSAIDFVQAAAGAEFECIVADMNLPLMDGLHLQAEIKRLLPHVSMVFVSGHGDLSIGVAAMKGGAVDFLEKPVADEGLIKSVRRGVELARERKALHEKCIELESRYQTLTRREREVFNLITLGRLNKQAGAELGTTERTIKAHRGRVMQKMRADSFAALVQMAGLLAGASAAAPQTAAPRAKELIAS